MAKYEVDANGKTRMIEQMKQNLAMNLVKISDYDVGSQIGRGRKLDTLPYSGESRLFLSVLCGND